MYARMTRKTITNRVNKLLMKVLRATEEPNMWEMNFYLSYFWFALYRFWHTDNIINLCWFYHCINSELSNTSLLQRASSTHLPFFVFFCCSPKIEFRWLFIHLHYTLTSAFHFFFTSSFTFTFSFKILDKCGLKFDVQWYSTSWHIKSINFHSTMI